MIRAFDQSKRMSAILWFAVFILAAVPALGHDEQEPTSKILFTNAKIFDGKSKQLTAPTSVLVTGNKIEKIGDGLKASDGMQVIDATGHTLTPGFIATHEHIIGQMPFSDIFNKDTRFAAYVATDTVRNYLMNGFTTIRDVAGNTYSLKQVIDRGLVVGPRIYPSGPMISQTAGHSDHRQDSDDSALAGGTWDAMVRNGDMVVVDGVPEVLKAVRENLRRGATQIKIAVGGGTGSYSDPLDVVQFSPEEIKAATDSAADWGTYVLAHVYNSDGVRRAIDNGVKCIEHANLVDEETLRYMHEKDVWLSPQVIVFTFIPKGYTADQAAKHRQAYAGIDNLFTIAKKIGYTKISFGTDIITDPEMIKKMNEEFVHRLKWFEPAEILRQATSSSAELLAMSGKRNPYPGKLGVIEEGAYADILLIKGNPLEDIKILTTPTENITLIMKDGTIYKSPADKE